MTPGQLAVPSIETNDQNHGEPQVVIHTGAGPTGRSGPIARTAAALLSVQGVTWLTSLVGILVIPRYLGAGNLGIWAVAGTLATIVGLVASWGTSNQLIKGIARDPSQGTDIFVHVVLVRLAIWLAFAVVAVTVILLAVDGRTARAVMLIMVGGGAVALVGGAAVSGLQGNQTLGRLSIFSALLGILSQTAVIIFLLQGGGLVGLSLIGLAFGVVGTVTAVFLFSREFGHRVVLSRATAVAVASGGIAFLAWDVANQTYASIDYFLLAALTDSKTVGEYAFAFRLAGIPFFAATVVTASIYPALAAAAHNDRAFFKRLLSEGTRIVLIASLPMATGLIVLAPELTRLIGGGDQYDEAIPLLIILCIQIPLVAIDTVLGTGVFALDMQRRLAVVGWCAAVLNPLVNLAAIPLSVHWFQDGAIGAAAITAMTECFVGAWIWRMLGDNLNHRYVFSAMFRSLAACLVMGIIVYVARPYVGVFVAIPLGAVVYGVMALWLGLVSFAEAKRLRAALHQESAKPVTA